MSQLELYFSKRHTCACACGSACGAITFLGLRKRLRSKIFRVVVRALSAQLLCLALPTSGAHCGLLCLLCHSKPTVCHTMPTRGPCYAYNVILSCSTYCGTPCLLILCLFFHNEPSVCHNLPTKVSCYPYYNILSCSAYYGILCNKKPTMPTVP